MQSGNVLGERVTGRQALTEGLPALVERLKNSGKQVFVVADIPKLLFSPRGQLTARLIPLRGEIGQMLNGGRNITGDDFTAAHSLADRERTYRYFIALAPKLGATGLVDPRRQLCTADRCKFAQDNLPLYFDDHHLSARGSRLIDWSIVLAAAKRT